MNRETLLTVFAVGVIFTFGLFAVNEMVLVWEPAPTEVEYKAELEDLEELSMRGY